MAFCCISFAMIPMLCTTVLPGNQSVFSDHSCQFESRTKPGKVQWSVLKCVQMNQNRSHFSKPETFGIYCCTFRFFKNSSAQVCTDVVWLCSAGCRWSSTWMKTPSKRGWSFSSLKTKGQVSISDRRYHKNFLSSKSEMLTGLLMLVLIAING